MTSSLRLGRVLGISIGVHWTWFLIFVLLAFSLAGHYFPMLHPGWPSTSYWALSIITSLIFFASVLAHELAHSLVSRRYGVPVRGITLFFFGGVAEITKEVDRPGEELMMALAGPCTSLVIAAIFGFLWLISPVLSPELHALAGWLGWINLGVGLFNLIPGFPLDGGRVLRAIVWWVTGDFRKATLIASTLGRGVAYLFIVAGLWQVFAGNWANGLWIAFIGWFLENAATSGYRQVAVREALLGVTAQEVMMTDCPRIPRNVTLAELVYEKILRTSRRCFPVVEEGRVLGIVTLHHVRGVPQGRWATTTVGEVMTPFDRLKKVEPDEELLRVMQLMTEEDVNQLPVVREGQLLGMVARDNVLQFLRMRAELGI